MKYTQGEWRHVIEKDGININDVIKNNNQYIATIHVTGPDEEWKANAKLISAAPDLLNALVELKRWVGKLDDWKGIDPPTEIVDAAINKATK